MVSLCYSLDNLTDIWEKKPKACDRRLAINTARKPLDFALCFQFCKHTTRLPFCT